MGTDFNSIPPKARIVYLRGQQVAIERMCRKLEAEAAELQDLIEQLKAEIGEVKQPKTERLFEEKQEAAVLLKQDEQGE